MSVKVERVLEELKSMNLLEASDLIKKIEETFGVDARFVGSAIAAPIVDKTVKTDENLIEEKTEFDVILQEVPSSKRITVIKVVRSLTSLGLKEAKDLIESVPKAISEAVSKEKADEIKKMLEDAGAIVVIK
uniref:Large ribosomal subunit protein bL12c n=1 Tax=Trachelomonas grandis TaxID=215769 RepID=A0A385UL06_9EUGL|nr:ribosomal protein L12 [Trachelomonas grandis]